MNTIADDQINLSFMLEVYLMQHAFYFRHVLLKMEAITNHRYESIVTIIIMNIKLIVFIRLFESNPNEANRLL